MNDVKVKKSQVDKQTRESVKIGMTRLTEECRSAAEAYAAGASLETIIREWPSAQRWRPTEDELRKMIAIGRRLDGMKARQQAQEIAELMLGVMQRAVQI